MVGVADASQAEKSLNKKGLQIFAGARTVFLESGYDASTMDAIARGAGVSKATLYAHFANKEDLFEAMIRQECRAIGGRIYKPDATRRDIRHELLEMARNISAIFTAQDGLDLYRVLVPVAPRFPRLAQAFYDEGPGVCYQQFSAFLRALCDQGRLQIPDVDLAAEQFMSLIRGDMDLSGALALPPRPPEAVETLIRSGITMFLDYYGA